MIPWAIRVHDQQGISIGSATSVQLTAECHEACTHVFSSTNCPFAWGDLDPHLINGSLSPPELTTQTASPLVQQFLHSSPQTVPIHYNGPPFLPSKLSLPIGGSGPPFNTWFLGPIRTQNPNSILIGSPIFARFTTVTDRQTERQTTLLSLLPVQ